MSFPRKRESSGFDVILSESKNLLVGAEPSEARVGPFLIMMGYPVSPTSWLKKIFLGIEPPADTTLDSGTEKEPLARAWSLKDILWWPVGTEELARRGVFACLILTCYFAVNAIASTANSVFSQNLSGFFQIVTTIIPALTFPVLFALIVWGLFKLNRTAAVAGLLYCLISIIISGYQILTGSPMAKWQPPQIGRSVFSALVYLNGVRGAAAYKRLCDSKASPTVNES